MTSEKLFCMHSGNPGRCTPPGCTASCRGKRRDLYLFRDHSGTWRYADRDQWNRDASAFRWNRQSGCRLYDLQTWRRTGGNLFPCTAVHQREAKQKVVDLAKQVSKYTGPIKAHVVNFTDIQLYIYEKCPHDELTIIMRRYMMRIAEHFAKEDGCLGLITGESIGQVASQTMQSLMATNDVCTLPVYRPLIGFDKQEIVDISEKIGTYETSILPYEDCCTIFVAKHPVTKPNVEVIRKSEENLSEKIDELFAEAVNTVETIIVK